MGTGPCRWSWSRESRALAAVAELQFTKRCGTHCPWGEPRIRFFGFKTESWPQLVDPSPEDTCRTSQSGPVGSHNPPRLPILAKTNALLRSPHMQTPPSALPRATLFVYFSFRATADVSTRRVVTGTVQFRDAITNQLFFIDVHRSNRVHQPIQAPCTAPLHRSCRVDLTGFLGASLQKQTRPKEGRALSNWRPRREEGGVEELPPGRPSR